MFLRVQPSTDMTDFFLGAWAVTLSPTFPSMSITRKGTDNNLTANQDVEHVQLGARPSSNIAALKHWLRDPYLC